MKMNLTRDIATGKILSNGAPIVLGGGHYYIFKKDDKPVRCLAKPGQKPGEELPFRIENTSPPFQLEEFPVMALTWEPEPWKMFFDHLKMFNECNFLRLWLTGGTEVSGTGNEPEPLDLTPFLGGFVGGTWKWQVYKAVSTANGWNNEYFRKLNKFVTLAEEAGIAVQISLFNYDDLTHHEGNSSTKGWCRSPWNPKLSLNPAGIPDWGDKHLVNPVNDYFKCSDIRNDAKESARQAFFVAPGNLLWEVQQALIKKTLETLKDRTNVIYEVMNEARGTHLQLSKFNSKVVGWIKEVTKNWTYKPLISVNATKLSGGVFDVDYWRDNNLAIKNYERIDAISYHGLTGYPSANQMLCCREKKGVPHVNPESIKARYKRHFDPDKRVGHDTKSLIYCTDAVRIGCLTHIYKDDKNIAHELEVRDGQFFANYPYKSEFSPGDKRLKSDLQNWAYWCLSAGAAKPGTAHFQNHSLNQVTFRRIHRAMIDARESPLTITAIEPEEANAEAVTV